MRRFSSMAMGVTAFLAACTGSAVDTNGTLDVKSTQSGLQGSFQLGDSSLRFSSREVEPGTVDVVVSVHGLDLTAMVNSKQNAAEVDGFAADGTDTQLVAHDREVLKSFVKALDESGNDGSLAAATLSRVTSNWSQTPDTVPLARSVVGTENRSWVSLCGYFGSYVDATHDDNNYSDFSANSTSHAHVGYRSASTFYYVNGSWTTTVQDHKPLLYEYGNCYANCGAGCPGGAQTLTLDCHDHDQCVRNGHAIASIWCDDEFTSASDDEFFAPTCSGT